MFERRKPHRPQKRLDSLIGAGTVVRGDVVFTGGLRVDGTVVGNISTVDHQPGTLVVSEHARIEGEVRVSHVVVNGTVEGPVSAKDYLELEAKARVHGDVQYRSLEMHVGAIVEGELSHVEQETAAVVELKRVAGE